MKRFYLKQLLAAILLLCSVAVNATVYSGTCGTNVNWSLDTETGVLNITGTGAMEDYSNSNSSSYAPWYNYWGNTTTIIIGNGVTSIGNHAFRGCSSLTSVTIGNSVTSIGNHAFSGCSSLTSIEIPNSVTTIAEYAFSSCTGLISITIPNSVTTIAMYAFTGCDGLTSIEIPNSVTSIGESALYKCTSLTSVEIPNSVTSIENSAFSGCSSLTSVTIGNSVTSIGSKAFYNCTSLTSIEIPNSVTSIGNQAFYGCSSLTSIEIPNSVTSIEVWAFMNCSNLTSVTIHCENVGYNWFGTKPSIKEIILGENVRTIEQCAFMNCSGITSITIPNSVTTIGNQAFYNCTSLTSVEIPNSVASIGNYAFNLCSGLISIVVDEGNSVYDSRENCNAIIETATNALLRGCKNTIIPNSVTSIENTAFSGCTGLISIEIPNSVTSIGESALYNCTSLTSVEIPNSVTSIENSAFSGCTGLISITIPNSVTSIGSKAFYNCTSLTSVEIPNSVASIGNSAFQNCTGITSIEIPNSVTSIGNYAFYGCSSLTSIEIPNSVASIGNYAFYGCTDLTEIYSLAETPATIASGTFNDYTITLYVPTGAKAAYEAADYWKNFTNIVEMAPEEEETPTEVTITIGQYGTATYCSPYALDFSEVEGLKAYTATGYNTSTGVITMTRTKTAAEGTGLFLIGEPGEYTVPVIEYSSDYMLNMLVGTLEATDVNNTTDDGNYINFKYTIIDGSSQPMFYQFEDGSTLSAGKAYLQVPARLIPSTASKAIGIRFDEGLTTDIDRIESENSDVQTIFDLNGRRVSELVKGGVYIIDGKKVVL